LATFAPDATPRCIYRYVNGGLAHNIQFRGYRGEARATSEARTAIAATNLFTALAPIICTDFAWLSALYIPQDTNVSSPAGLPDPVTGTFAPSVYSPEDKIRMLSFHGKSSGGSKTSCEAFGMILTTDDTTPGHIGKDFRITTGESAIIADAVAALAAQNLAGIDNTILTWYGYANIKVHDYWLRQVRKGLVS
jgi:hypothetical protein